MSLLFGSPKACKGAAKPWKADWCISLISPDDTTSPCKAIPSSRGPEITLTF